ncbi:MAG: biopolymer transporter ExbD [bacterium]|nr:biopolymer transporter ExbD [bacterium]
MRNKKRRNKGARIQTKTDVVPIINVSLVVVLTLMVISPFLNKSEMEVVLPEATTAETEDQDKVEIIFTLDGQLAVQEEEVSFDELRLVLEDQFSGHPSRIAVLKADQGIPYGDVELVIAQIQKAGAPRIAIATEQVTGGGS